MPGTYQLYPHITTNRIIQTLILRLAMHPWMQVPMIVDPSGNPVRINRFRNFDGKELKNPKGITLSVFPFHYGKSKEDTTLTVGTNNSSAKVIPTDGTLGSNGLDPTAYFKVRLNVMLKLNAFGFSQDSQADSRIIHGQESNFEFNFIEMLLRQYTDMVVMMLSANDMRKLPNLLNGKPMLATSYVDHWNYPSSGWDEGPNSLLHSATILWQAEYYLPREWRFPERYKPIDLVDGMIPVGYANINGVQTAIYYEYVTGKYFDENSNEVVRSDLNEASGALSTSLNSELIQLIDSAPRELFDFSLFFKQVDDGWNS